MATITPSASEDELSSPMILTNPASTRVRRPARDLPSDPATDSSANTTPLQNLRRLAAVSRQAMRDARLTPTPRATRAVSALSLPRPARRPAIGDARQSSAVPVPTTPHAIRAMEERRRVALTPSREKRRASGRGVERGSPFDLLQALSRVASVPARLQQAQTASATEREEDEEDELTSSDADRQPPSILSESEESEGIARPPRLSLPMEEMRIDEGDDSRVLDPPEMSRLDEDITLKSIEGSRRAELDASMLATRRGRLSDFSDLFDDPKDSVQNDTRRLGSPSFVGVDQSLFAGLQAGFVVASHVGNSTDVCRDDTLDLGRVPFDQEGTASPRIFGRDAELADSTFRFDIPQDVTETVSEDEEADNPEDDDANPNAVRSAINLGGDDDSAPEDFGSPSASEAEEDAVIVEDEAGDDANVGVFLDEADEDDILLNNEGVQSEGDRDDDEEDTPDMKQRVNANEAITSPQFRPVTKRFLPTEDTATELPIEEAEQTLVITRPRSAPTQRTQAPRKLTAASTRPSRTPKQAIISKHGAKVPSLPASVVKSLADSFLPHAGKSSKKTKKDTVAALSQATDWFFEQIAEDLDAYSKHADRDTIEEADVIALMKRQRVLATGAKNAQGVRSAAPGSSRATLFSLAQRFLPRELMTELRMDPPPDEKRRKRRRISEGGEFE